MGYAVVADVVAAGALVVRKCLWMMFVDVAAVAVEWGGVLGWLRWLRWGWSSPSSLDKSGRICHPRSPLLRTVDTAAAVVGRGALEDDAVAAVGAGWRTPVDVVAVELDSLLERDDVVIASVDAGVAVSVTGTAVAAAGKVMVELGGTGAACAVVVVFAAA